jgi:hypothetical protein
LGIILTGKYNVYQVKITDNNNTYIIPGQR